MLTNNKQLVSCQASQPAAQHKAVPHLYTTRYPANLYQANYNTYQLLKQTSMLSHAKKHPAYLTLHISIHSHTAEAATVYCKSFSQSSLPLKQVHHTLLGTTWQQTAGTTVSVCLEGLNSLYLLVHGAVIVMVVQSSMYLLPVASLPLYKALRRNNNHSISQIRNLPQGALQHMKHVQKTLT